MSSHLPHLNLDLNNISCARSVMCLARLALKPHNQGVLHCTCMVYYNVHHIIINAVYIYEYFVLYAYMYIYILLLLLVYYNAADWQGFR